MNRLALLACMGIAAGFSIGCGDTTATSSIENRTAYVCRESAQIVVAAVQATPAVHPETGRRTPMPALYCPQCRQWYPAPPLEVLQRSPGAAVCPKHKTPLRGSGPLPRT